jgi:integrase
VRRTAGTKTRYLGVESLGDGMYRIRAKAKSPKQKTPIERDRVVKAKSAAEAAQMRAALIDEIRDGDSPKKRASRPTVRSFAELWLEARANKLTSGTRGLYIGVISRLVNTHLGDVYFDALRPLDVQAWVNDLATEYAPTTVRAVFGIFRGMVTTAVAQLDLPRDPCRGVELPDGKGKKKRALTVPELVRLLDELRARDLELHALVITMGLTGLRSTHVCALRWGDVDEAAGVLRIAQRVYKGDVGPKTKIKSAPDEYPLGPELAEVLKAQRQRLIARQAKGLAEGWVFPGERSGKPYPPYSLIEWKRALVACGLGTMAGAKFEPAFTPHGLRYTWRDMLRKTHVPPEVVRHLGGWASDATADGYATVRLDEATAAVGGVLRLVRGGDESGDRGSVGTRSPTEK